MRGTTVKQSFRADTRDLENTAQKNLKEFKRIERKLRKDNKLIIVKRGNITIETTGTEKDSRIVDYIDNGVNVEYVKLKNII